MADENAVTLVLRPATLRRPAERGRIGVWALIRSLASMAVIFTGLLMLIGVLSVAFAFGL